MKTKHLKYMACFALALPQLAVLPAHAEEALSPLVVTAGRIAEDPARVSADTTVISREDIETSQAITIADILRSQAGIDVASSGGLGKTTSVFIRGGNSGHTLVLIDGVRVGAATSGSFDWANLSTADIERIEIVRGAQSSLYGADAMGGVIQIFTRKGKKGIQTNAFAEAGSYGTQSGGVSVQGGNESGVTYALSAETLRSDGFSAAVNGTEADPYKRTTLSGRIGFQVGDGDIELMVRNVDAETGLDGFDPATFVFGDVLNFTQKTTQNVGSIKVSYPISDMFETTLQLSRSMDDVIGTDPVTAWNNSDFKTTIDQLTWQNHIDLATVSILFGVDMHKDNGKSSSAGFDETITQKAVFASFSETLGLVDINASVRYDANSVSDNQTTYKLGSVFHIDNSFDITTNYATGFKAPSINDLYFPDNFGSHGNPNLKAETSKGWDIGLNYQAENNDVTYDIRVVYFNQKYNNLISWVETPPGSFAYIPANVDAASTKGTELSVHISHNLGFLRANWTVLDATDDGTGLLLARRAKDSGSIILGTDISGFHGEIQHDIVGKRFSDSQNTKVLDAYNKTDIRVSYALDHTWKLKFRAENIGDKVYEEVSGYAVPGRAWYAGVSAVF